MIYFWNAENIETRRDKSWKIEEETTCGKSKKWGKFERTEKPLNKKLTIGERER